LCALFTVITCRLVYVGSLDSGIWVFSQNSDGTLKPLAHPERTSSGFLAVSPNGKNLYATGAGDKYVAYGINGSDLIRYNDLPGHDGQECWTTHVSVHPDGGAIFGANYKDGSFVSFSLETNGALKQRTSLFTPGTGSHGVPDRQDGPHAHMITTSPNPKFVVGMDLGADRVWVWRYNQSTRSLTPNTPDSFRAPVGSGTRHIAFGKSGDYAYTINEIASTLLVLKFDKRGGSFTQIQSISSLQSYMRGDRSITAGEIRMHPNGKWLYVTNRNGQSNNVGLYRVNPMDGTLTQSDFVWSRAVSPRGMNVDPSGRYLYVADEKSNQAGNSLFAFKIDQQAGTLSVIGEYNTGGSCSDVEFGLDTGK